MFRICEEYNIKPEGACYIDTFDRAQIDWFAGKIEVSYWRLIKDSAGYAE